MFSFGTTDVNKDGRLSSSNHLKAEPGRPGRRVLPSSTRRGGANDGVSVHIPPIMRIMSLFVCLSSKLKARVVHLCMLPLVRISLCCAVLSK